MSRTAELVAFVSLADGGLSPRVLAAAIRRRWPEVTADQVREAKAAAGLGLPCDLEARVALDVAAAGVLGRRR